MLEKILAGLFLVGAWLCCMVGTLQIESETSVLKWIDIQNVTLTDLEPAGSEESWLNPNLYVARNKHGRGEIPGKYVDKLGIFFYAESGTWHNSSSCEVLVYPRGSVSWIPVEIMKSLENVIIGGIDPRTNEILRICRLEISAGRNVKENHLVPGKLTTSGECIGVWNGIVSEKSNYEVLLMNAYGKVKSAKEQKKFQYDDHFWPEYERKDLALVVSIYNFDVKSIQREGIHRYTVHMKRFLKQLGYTILNDDWDDLAGIWCFEEVQEFTEACQIQTPDSIIAYIGCHGLHEEIDSSDLTIVKWNDLNTEIEEITKVDINTNTNESYRHNCPELKGKPSIFLVSACQDYEMNFEFGEGNCRRREKVVREEIKRRYW